MNHDFLGREINVGDYVVGIVYMKTSADFRKGVVLKTTAKTAVVKLDRGQERRFNFDKLVKISYRDCSLKEAVGDDWQ